MTPEDMARAVLETDALVRPERRLDGVIDSASFAEVGMGGGRADRMNALGCRWQPSENAKLKPQRFKMRAEPIRLLRGCDRSRKWAGKAFKNHSTDLRTPRRVKTAAR